MDNCVDISKYGPLEFNDTTAEMCCYKMTTICTPRTEEICVDVPSFKCEVVGYTECDNAPTVTTVRDDEIGHEQFYGQECVESKRKEVISEVKKMPVCHNVTKQQCDTKWVVTPEGEKVWAGNENCKNVTWEDCTLEDRIITQEVDVFDCSRSNNPIEFQYPITKNSEVKTVSGLCQAKASTVCTQSSQVKCKTITWQDCDDVIEQNCFSSFFRLPYQEFDHRLRCSVGSSAT